MYRVYVQGVHRVYVLGVCTGCMYRVCMYRVYVRGVCTGCMYRVCMYRVYVHRVYVHRVYECGVLLYMFTCGEYEIIGARVVI